MESLKIPLPMLNPSCFSSRRSHLDSTSYRTLLRIFSLCLHEEESPNSSQEQPCDANPSVDSASNEKAVTISTSPPQPSADPNPTLQTTRDYQMGEDSGNRKNSSELESFDALEGLEDDDDGSIDMEFLEGIMADCTKLIDEEQQETDELLNSNSERDASFVNSKTVEEQGIAVGSDKEIGQETGSEMFNYDDLKGQDGRKECGSCDVQITEVEKLRETEEATGQEVYTGFDPLIECFGSRDLDSSPVNEGIEEGEIPVDCGNANQTPDSMSEDADLEDEKSEEGSALNETGKNANPTKAMSSSSDMDHGNKHGRLTVINSSKSGPSSLVHHSKQRLHGKAAANADIRCKAATRDELQFNRDVENLVDNKIEMGVDSEDIEVMVRKKRGSGNEERKARRKIAKKRRRAQKEREQGVKRLKLRPIKKPNEVKICSYYMNGRCQQGDKCKFSHDDIPSTKYKPCRHFARNSCLKGDDCPYDHQLSNYPCDNYTLNGTCSRGDGCKFSHKLPNKEGSSSALALSISDPLLSSGKSNLVKQLHNNRGTTVATDQPKISTTCSKYILHNPSAGNILNSPNKPTHIPTGIRFLSFGKVPSDIADQRKDSLLLASCGGIRNQQSQQKLLAVGQKDNLSLAQQSIPAAQCGQNKIYNPVKFATSSTLGSKKVSSSSFVAGPAGVPSSSLRSEILEASKILDEFLFGGVS